MGSPLARFRLWRRSRLPWKALEAEARRQGCSPADIFFDLAGRMSGEPDRETGRAEQRHRGLEPDRA